jgi:hypothetical protein
VPRRTANDLRKERYAERTNAQTIQSHLIDPHQPRTYHASAARS